MTRQEIEQAYETRDGCIVSPGKFEGEPIYAPYLYDCLMSGCSDETLDWTDETTSDIFEVDAELRAMFPEIGDGTVAIVCYESDSGFFNTEEVTQGELDEYRARNEREWEEHNEEEDA